MFRPSTKTLRRTLIATAAVVGASLFTFGGASEAEARRCYRGGGGYGYGYGIGAPPVFVGPTYAAPVVYGYRGGYAAPYYGYGGGYGVGYRGGYYGRHGVSFAIGF